MSSRQDSQWTAQAKSRIKRLLAKEPLDRIQSQSAVMAARTLMEDRSVSVDPVSAAAGKERFFGELQKRFALGCWGDDLSHRASV